MKVLDTDTLTLLLQGHPKVLQRRQQESDEVVIGVATRVEVLQGRFASLFKAADGEELKRGQQRLDQADRDLRPFRVLSITDAIAAEFDRLRQIKRLKKIRRGDMPIAAIALGSHATLVTCNVKDFQTVPGLKIENWAD
jgi:tRNA(fMet)-specific endonuclease VapC